MTTDSSAAAAPEAESPSSGQLPRVLGLYSAVFVVVGSVIGSGVFLKANKIASALPDFTSIISVWVLVGIVTLCGSLALAELAAMFPHAGGTYVYLREAYGRLPAFLWGWTEFWIIRTGSVGALSCATVIYLNQVVPISIAMQEALAILIVVGLAVVNVVGTRWGAGMQNVTTMVKVGFLGAIILLPWLMGQIHPSYLAERISKPPEYDFFKAYGLAMIAVLWAYDGWINIGPVAEEIHHPQRNVPLALIFGALLIMAVYVGANFSYHLVLPIQDIAEVPGTKRVVVADLFRQLFGPVGAKIAALGVMCSTFGAVNGNLLTGPRIWFAMSRDRMVPAGLSRIHPRWKTPANAIILQAAWTVTLIVAVYALNSRSSTAKTDASAAKTHSQSGSVGLNSGSAPPAKTATGSGATTEAAAKELAAAGKAHDAFDALTDFVIFGGQIFYALAVGAVFVCRRTHPHLARPYRTWGYPFTPAIYLLAFVAALISLLVEKWQQSLAGSVIILAGAIYYAYVSRRSGA